MSDHSQSAEIITPKRAGGAYTAAVRRWRILLPLLALGIIGAILAWPQLDTTPVEVTVSDVEVESNTINMINPRYRGQTEKGEPFLVQADAARQTMQDPALVELDRIRAELETKDGALTLSAPTGRYHTTDKQLALDGPVALNSAMGYTLAAGNLRYDVAMGAGGSDQPLTADGPMGSIRADRFEVTEEGNRIIFSGHVKLIYRGEALP